MDHLSSTASFTPATRTLEYDHDMQSLLAPISDTLNSTRQGLSIAGLTLRSNTLVSTDDDIQDALSTKADLKTKKNEIECDLEQSERKMNSLHLEYTESGNMSVIYLNQEQALKVIVQSKRQKVVDSKIMQQAAQSGGSVRNALMGQKIDGICVKTMNSTH